MAGWMQDGWMDEWIGGGWISRLIDVQMDVDRWMDVDWIQMDGWMEQSFYMSLFLTPDVIQCWSCCFCFSYRCIIYDLGSHSLFDIKL